MPETEMSTPEALKRSLEVSANRFNLKCLAVLCGFTVLCAICNRIGVFTVDPVTMRVAVITAFLFFCLPIVVWIVHDGICRRAPTVLSHSKFKYLIILSTYADITVTCVTLTFHAILLKPGKLTPEEFDVIKGHTTKGGAMIRTLFSEMEDTVFLRLAEEITVSHHDIIRILKGIVEDAGEK